MLENELKKLRSKLAFLNKTEAYKIYTNDILHNLVDKKPRTIEELKTVKGFGDKKVQKYGKDIIECINSVLGV